MKKILSSICLSLFLAMIIQAQGTYGSTQIFDVIYSDGGTWVTPTHIFEKNGYTFTITTGSDLRPAQSKNFETSNITTPVTKVTYTGALKCRGVEISEIPSLGQITLPFHNASSSNVRTITLQIYDGTNWKDADKISLPGNGSTLYRPASVISKSAVKLKFVADGDFFFYGVDAYNHITADGVPEFLFASPAEDSFLPGSGVISLTFDELVKAGDEDITLGAATVDGITYKGNTVEITYSGFNADASLSVSADAIVDLVGNPLNEAVSIAYQRDVTPPKLINTYPEENSAIHIGDLGEEERKIKLTFSEPVQLDETKTITFCNYEGTVCGNVIPTVSGSVLTISYSGLAYGSGIVGEGFWCIQRLFIPAGCVLDLSGNEAEDKSGRKDINVMYQTGERDCYSPMYSGQSMPEYASEQPVSGSISFWFSEIVVVEAQNATINGERAVLSSSGKTIGLNYTALPYDDSQIDVYIPPTCITDTCGNYYTDPIELIFWTKTKTPKAFDAVVAADGSGDYATIQAAIDAITDDSERTFIFIRKGTYNEKLCIWKDNVSLIGEDADQVIITWDECASTSTVPPSDYGTGINSAGTDASYTMLITGDNFYGENFTVRNDYDYVAGESVDTNRQAVVIEHKDGDKHVLKNVKMYSFQDTYYPKSANKRQYLTNCYILGGTDFIFGGGTAFIDNSVIDCYEGGQYITAAADTEKEFGIIINNSEIKYAGKTPIGDKRKFYLGRPWKSPAKTAFVNNRFEDELIRDEGWSVWSGNENHLTATYAEYGNTLSGGSAMNTDSHVDWSVQLSAKEAVRFDIDNAFNYGENDTWNPLGFCTEPDEITTFIVDAAGELAWDEPSHAVGYLLFKNGDFLTNVTSNSYTDTESVNGDLYEVAAYNEYGATTSTKTVSQSSNINNINTKKGFLKNTFVTDLLSLENKEDILSVKIINISGLPVFSTDSVSSEISIANLQPGFYFVVGNANNDQVYVNKIIKK